MSVIDKKIPKLVAITPNTNTKAVAVGQNIVFTFNEPIKKGKGTVIISDGKDTLSIPITDKQVSIKSKSLTINPSQDLIHNTDYTVKLSSNAVLDLAGNKFAGKTIVFDTVDTQAPKLLSLTRKNGEKSVALTKDITLNFNEKIQAGTGKITIDNGTGDRREILLTDKQVNLNGKTLSLLLDNSLLANSKYSITLDNKAVSDFAGNYFTGNKLSFSTLDTLSPNLTQFDTEHVSPDADLKLVFNETIKRGVGEVILSNGTTDIKISATDTKQIVVKGKTLIINPNADLQVNSNYTVKLPAGFVTDLTGNKLTGQSLAFSTVDTSAPTLLSSSPEQNEKAVTLTSTIILNFNEKIQAGTGKITLDNGAGDKRELPLTDKQVNFDGKTLTLKLDSALASNSSYGITLDTKAIQDLSGNYFAGKTFSFNTLDTVSPSLIQLVPTNNSENILPSAELKFTFDEAVKRGAGEVVLSNGKTNIKIPATDNTQIVIDNNALTINPTANFQENSNYTLQVPAGFVTDLAGNKIAASDVKFHVADVTPPKIATEGFSSVGSKLVFKFDEPIFAGTGNISLSNGTNTTTVSVTDKTQVSISDNSLSITPSNVLAAGKYTVQLPNGLVKDLAGNLLTGITEQTFSIKETTPPILVKTTPADDAVNVAKDSNLVFTFNEDVAVGLGSVVIRSDTDTRSIPLMNAQVSVSGKTVTINPYIDFQGGKNYSIWIGSNAIEDMAGNPFAGTAGSATLDFKIADSFLSGKAIDGYLAGSTVFADANGNGVWDPSEAKTTTDSKGDFVLKNGKGAIVAMGGIDLTTGKAFKGVLKAPEGSTFVTPLTTVQQGFVEQGLSVTDAGKAVAQAFGFDAEKVDLTKFDPIQSVKDADKAGTSQEDKELAKSVLASTAKVVNFLVTASEVLKGAGGNSVSTEKSSDALLKSLVTAISSNANGTVDLSDKSLLKTVLTEGAKEVSKNVANTSTNFETKIAVMADTVVSAIKSATDNITTAISTAITSSSLLTNVGDVSKFTQETVSNSLQSAAKTFDPTSDTAISALGSLENKLTGTAFADAKAAEDKAIADAAAAKAEADAAAAKVAADAAAAKVAADAAAAKAAADAEAAAEAARDRTPPTLSSSTPSDNATGVSISDNISLTFNENVKAGSGNIVITNNSDDTKNISISDTSQVTISGSTVIINPSTDLKVGYSYSVTSGAGVIQDSAGNSFAGSTGHFLTYTPINLESQNGTQITPAALNANGTMLVLNENASSSSFAKVTGFGADDVIKVSNLGSNHLIVESSDTDVTFTVNNSGGASQITLVGVISAGTAIGSLTAFNDLPIGNVLIV